MRNDRESFAGMTAFITSVEEGSFSAAAEKLRLTPSGVSKLVSRLEERLKVRLLQRTTRRMQLTQVGRAYYERARRIFEELDALEREVESHDDAPRGTLRLTAPTVLGHVRVLPLVLSFQDTYPEVNVELLLNDRVVDLVEEGIDVAVRMTASPPLSFVARKLGDDARVLCASPAYLSRRGRPSHPRDLADHDCIVFLAGGAVDDTWRLKPDPRSGEVEGVRVRGRFQANNTLSLREAALAGLGIVNLPDYLVGDDLRSGRLVAVLEGLVPVERAVYAVYPQAPFVPARVRELVRHLAEGFSRSARDAAPAAARPASRQKAR
ncbi:LysR family transcriptional regulator [Sorangium cellulosum]|uniref:LysR family transcriptional regulator n=1 Tax=Sorangium cellulosum TaxID=56 RepID=A0A2L0F0T0_SORCE|nr:LysR family transcriptional regulator [Sorangium cellulosum]AUX45178.1 LysR family transcriptional regulator [Sorangium cellulosum]